MRTTPALTVTGLTKRYGSHEAVSDLSFSVPAGKVTGSIVLHELSTRTGALGDVFLDLTSEGAQP